MFSEIHRLYFRFRGRGKAKVSDSKQTLKTIIKFDSKI